MQTRREREREYITLSGKVVTGIVQTRNTESKKKIYGAPEAPIIQGKTMRKKT
jgi:hypothetical protein